VANGLTARQPTDNVFGIKVIADQAERPVRVKMFTIEGDNSSRFLTPMLQGMEAEYGGCRCIVVAKNAKYAAFIMQVIIACRVL
jgi:hypothetical protein